MSQPHPSAAAALLALSHTLSLSAAQQSDLTQHDLPRLCIDVPSAIFLVTLGGTHLLIYAGPESQKLLAYHLAHSGVAYLLEQGHFQSATVGQAEAYLSRLQPFYLIETSPAGQQLCLQSTSGLPSPVVLQSTNPLFAQAQHLLATRPGFARDAAGHRAHIAHQQRVVSLYRQVTKQVIPNASSPVQSAPITAATFPKSWASKRYPADLEYVITHVSDQGQARILIETATVQAGFDAIRHDPWTRQLHAHTPSVFTLLARITIAAGTSWPDALAQLTARVPSVYRELPSSVYLPDKKGDRMITFPR